MQKPGVIFTALAFAAGAIYVWVVDPGLPADEPSHWSTVLFYAHHTRMPILGRPGVTYEAQMGPVAYMVDGGLVRASRAAGLSYATTFRVVRMLGVIEFAAVVMVIAALTRRLAFSSWSVEAAVGVFALNPMMLCMSASVQNDTLALLLAFLALNAALALLANRPVAGAAAIVGAIAGLAVLTKLTAWAVIPAIAGWMIWRHRRRSFVPVVVFASSVFAISGWWFVRNIVLYGDPTAAAGVHRAGVSFAPYRLHGAHGVAHMAEQVVTYLWLPTEYLRNLIHTPVELKAVLLATTTAVLVFGIRGFSDLTRDAWLVSACAILSVLAWVVSYLGVQAVAPRVAYAALPLWICLVALAFSRVPQRTGASVIAAGMVALNAWTLYEISRVAAPTFIHLTG